LLAVSAIRLSSHALRAILGQQVSVAGRLAFHFGVPIQTSMPSVTHLFPSPQRIAAAKFDEIGSLGITSQRASTAQGLTFRYPYILSAATSRNVSGGK